MESAVTTLDQAVRSLVRKPALSAAAVLCLALGIGPNTAVFSIVDAVLLKPLPYANPKRVVVVWDHFLQQGQPKSPMSRPEFDDLRTGAKSFEAVAAVGPQLVNITGQVDPERLVAARASEGLFSLLGVEATAGRVFMPEDHRAGSAPVAVLSRGLWQRRFGADPGIVGRTVLLNDQPTEVVGVLPADFRFGSFDYDIWLPMPDVAKPPPRTARFLTVVGRLAPGISIEQAQTEAGVVAGRMQAANPDVYPADSGWGLHLVTAREDLIGDVDTMLLVLALAVGLVLLIACANVTNLLLARAVARRKEVAIRASLGAGRGALLRQFLTESVLLSVAGGALGLLLATWVLKVVTRLGAGGLPRGETASINGGVLLFTLAVALVTGVVFGLVPAFQASRFDLRSTLQEGGKTSEMGGAGRRFRGALVVAEVALALVVLVGGGLVLRSFAHLLNLDPGYRPGHVLSLQLSLGRQKLPENHQVVDFFRRLTERLETVPGVRRAAVISNLPASSFTLNGDVVPQGGPGTDGQANVSTGWRVVSAGYFEAMGIPLLQGRGLEPSDDADAPQVVLVDRHLADRLWPGQGAVGKRLRLDTPRPEAGGWREVVGVVGNVRQQLAGDLTDQLYLPVAQYPTRIMSVVVRTSGDPEALVPQVRSVVRQLDPTLPVEDLESMVQRQRESIAQPRLTMVLFVSFALVALLLAMLGVYGVIAYSTAQRSQEIGVRITLGARRSEVVRLVLVQGLRLTGLGLAVGLLGALAMSRLVEGFVFGVRGMDLVTFLWVVGLLAVLGATASCLPALRAASVRPVDALRPE